MSGTTFTDIASGATVQVDDGTFLTLTGGATINGGTINDGAAGEADKSVFGTIDITGPSTISNASLNYGGVTIASGVVLTLDNDTVNGTTFSDTASGATIQIDDGTTLTLTGGATIKAVPSMMARPAEPASRQYSATSQSQVRAQSAMPS